MESFNQTLTQYRSLLAQVRRGESVRLTNRNLDTGKLVKPGEYALADKAYRELTEKLSKSDFANADEDLRREILAFYAGSSISEPNTAQAIQRLKTLTK